MQAIELAISSDTGLAIALLARYYAVISWSLPLAAVISLPAISADELDSHCL